MREVRRCISAALMGNRRDLQGTLCNFSRRCMLMIDGLDEASDATAARSLVAVLTVLADRSGIPIVATPHGIRNLGELAASWDRCDLATLSDEQRRALANLWFGVLENLETGSSATQSQIKSRARRKHCTFRNGTEHTDPHHRVVMAQRLGHEDCPPSGNEATQAEVAKLLGDRTTDGSPLSRRRLLGGPLPSSCTCSCGATSRSREDRRHPPR
jgi:hypothetical protein